MIEHICHLRDRASVAGVICGCRLIRSAITARKNPSQLNQYRALDELFGNREFNSSLCRNLIVVLKLYVHYHFATIQSVLLGEGHEKMNKLLNKNSYTVYNVNPNVHTVDKRKSNNIVKQNSFGKP